MIKFRQAHKNEVIQLQALNDEAFHDNPIYDPDLKLDWAQSMVGKTYFTNLLTNKNDYCLVAEDKGKLVGYIAAGTKTFDDRNSTYIEIQNLGVIPAYRRQGVGQQLMNRCLTWAKAKGYKKAYLKSYFKNARALTFYKKNKFTEISVSMEKEL